MKWLRSYEVAARLQAQLKKTRVVSVGDRESDIDELFAAAHEHLEAGARPGHRDHSVRAS